MTSPALGAPSEGITLADNGDAGQFEVFVAGEPAGLAVYEQRGDVRTFTHTIILPTFAHRGLGGILAEAALADARERGFSVVPQCPFIAAYISAHPEFLNLVEDGSRLKMLGDDLP